MSNMFVFLSSSSSCFSVTSCHWVVCNISPQSSNHIQCGFTEAKWKTWWHSCLFFVFFLKKKNQSGCNLFVYWWFRKKAITTTFNDLALSELCRPAHYTHAWTCTTGVVKLQKVDGCEKCHPSDNERKKCQCLCALAKCLCVHSYER